MGDGALDMCEVIRREQKEAVIYFNIYGFDALKVPVEFAIKEFESDK